MKNLVCVTPPALEPLTLEEVKSYLRFDEGLTADDEYISALITVAREYCEGFQNRAYITQTWQVSFPYWPDYTIDLPLGNLQRINSITYQGEQQEETSRSRLEIASITFKFILIAVIILAATL